MYPPGPSSKKRRRDDPDEIDNSKNYDGFMDDESEPYRFGTTVLPVANLPNSFDGVPQDGMEYLFTVRREEKRLPLVTRVLNPYSVDDTNKKPPHRDEAETTNIRSALPTDEWRTCFEERFRNFRANIQQPSIHISLPCGARSTSRIPEMRERDRWWAFFRGDMNWEKIPSYQLHSKRNGTSERTRKQTIGYDEELPKSKGKLRGWVIYDEQLSWDQEDDDAATMKSHSNVGPSASRRAEDLGRSPEDTEPFDVPSRKDKAKEAAVGNALPTTSSSSHSQDTTDNKSTTLKQCAPREPTPELLNLLDQKVTFHLLKFFTQWIRGHFDRFSISPPPPIFEVPPHASHQTQDYDLTPTHGRWMFALLSRLDEHLTSDEISVLRNLAREVMSLIKESKEASRTSNTTLPMDEAACWMIVAAITGVWGQKDLWIDAEEALR